MIKKILLISTMAILGAYIVFATLFLTKKPEDAIAVSKPVSFSVTVLPPVFGPLKSIKL